MNTFSGYSVLSPNHYKWCVSKPMKIPFLDLLEHTGSENIGARIWRFPPKSANTWHKHVKAEEYYFVLEGIGKIRIGSDSITVPRHSGVLVGPELMRQVFNDTEEEVVWLIIGAPDKEFDNKEDFDLNLFWPEDPKQLPKELNGVNWPPEEIV